MKQFLTYVELYVQGWKLDADESMIGRKLYKDEIMKIISRLDAQSLAMASCVSKRWYTFACETCDMSMRFTAAESKHQDMAKAVHDVHKMVLRDSYWPDFVFWFVPYPRCGEALKMEYEVKLHKNATLDAFDVYGEEIARHTFEVVVDGTTFSSWTPSEGSTIFAIAGRIEESSKIEFLVDETVVESFSPDDFEVYASRL